MTQAIKSIDRSREAAIESFLTDTLQGSGHLKDGETAKIVVAITPAPPPKVSIEIKGPKKRRRSRQIPEVLGEQLSETDWESIMKIGWNGSCAHIIVALHDAFKGNPNAVIIRTALGVVNSAYVATINQKLKGERLPFRVRRTNPHVRLGSEEARYRMVKIKI